MMMAFIKPVYAGDRLTVHGVVKELRPEAGDLLHWPVTDLR